MPVRFLHFIIAMVAGWLQREQEAAIEYLKEENRVLREQMSGKRLRFTDGQRRRLARRGKLVGRRGLHALGCIVTPDTIHALGCIVTPDTILRWYRQLVAEKYDGSKRRGPGRPRTVEELRALVVSIAVRQSELGLYADS